MAYLKKGNDVSFRNVSLTAEKEPAFTNFTSSNENPRPNCVLEIRKADGTTVIEYEGERIAVGVTRKDKCILLPKFLPTARLWVRERNGSGIAYKVPRDLEIQDESQVFEIPAGSKEVEVFGDKYFSAVYDLINP